MLEPGIYVLATPIGCLQDITLRAIEVLKTVDLVLCEDTRVTKKLLQHLGISAKTQSLHKFNEAHSITTILAQITNGARIALVSDAGTPAIHDPGAKLVAAAHAALVHVAVVPGPSSVTAALSVAGCYADTFWFQGFLPSKTSALTAALHQIDQTQTTVVCFESTHRIQQTLALIHTEVAPQRTLVLAKELTKIHESVRAVQVLEIPSILTEPATYFKGEWVLVFKPYSISQSGISQQAKTMLEHLVPVCGVSQAVKVTKAITGASKKELYDFAIATSAD